MTEARKLQQPIYFVPQNIYARASTRNVAEDLSGKTIGQWEVIQRAPNDGQTVRFYATHTAPGGCGSKNIHCVRRPSLLRKCGKQTCPDCLDERRKIGGLAAGCAPRYKERKVIKPGQTCRLCWGIPRGVKGKRCKSCKLPRGE